MRGNLDGNGVQVLLRLGHDSSIVGDYAAKLAPAILVNPAIGRKDQYGVVPGKATGTSKS